MTVGSYNSTRITKPTITDMGARGSNVALGNLPGFLHNMGSIVDNTTI